MSSASNDPRLPVMFIGHGSPMNAIEDNRFTREWQKITGTFPKPKAILCISAHWETSGTRILAVEKPRTIHDFGGFPDALYRMQYPAPGSMALAERVSHLLADRTAFSDEWGLDHGAWAVLMRMFPHADIPVIELSLDRTQPPPYHYDIARELSALRDEGVLLLGSGNMVHNLGMIEMRGNSLNEPYGFDWALEASDMFKRHITAHSHQPLIEYPKLGEHARMAIPTPEHFLPLLYILALERADERMRFFNDIAIGGSLTMTSIISERE